jgi:transposase-like protein
MKCPHCESTQTSKNGHRRAKQNYLCKHCGRQFLESYSPKGYSDDAKKICLKMYLDGMGFRAIARVTGISHNTVINWIKQSEISLTEPDAFVESSKESKTDCGETNLDFPPNGTAMLWNS